MQLPGRNQSDGTAGTPGNPTGRIRIEAENFSGQQGVETEACGDLGGTLDVGYIDVGNFISYNVATPVPGVYTLNFRLANGGSTASFQVRDSVSGAVLGTVSVPPTGGWQNYVTLSATATLPAGQQTLQLLCTSNNWNLNWLELLPPLTGSGGYNGNNAYHIEAEDFISQNGTLLEACQDAGGTYNVGSIDNGDWMDYRVNMPVGGTYQLRVRAATGNGGTVQLRTAAGTVLATLPISNTNGYQTFQTFTATVTLPAGVQTLRLAVTGGYLSVNWLELAAPAGAPPLDNYALVVNNNNNYAGGLYYDVENTFTVEFMVKPSGDHEIDVESTTGFGGTSGQKYVLFPVNGGESYDSRSGMGVSVGTNGVSVYEHAAAYMPALLVWESPTPLTEWTHVAVVYNNGKPSLYINGVWKKDGLPSPKSHVHPGTSLPGGYYGNQANGQVDEVRIWSVARTQQQLATNRDGELTGVQTGLVGYWPMNEGTGAVLHDVSGWGRDIDLTHAGYGSASWTNGRYSINTATGSYRYAFNGKEKDQDISEDGYDYGARIYDARLGKFLSVDPLASSYPWYTPYQYAGNKPIKFIDLDGLEEASPEERQRAVSYVENSIKSYISEYATKGAFVNINPKILSDELISAIKNPNTLREKSDIGKNLCGVYAFSYIYALYDPGSFARGTADLFIRGETELNGGYKIAPEDELKEVGQNNGQSLPVLIFGGSIRSRNNQFVDYSNRFFGSTNSASMKSWLKNILNVEVTEFSYGHETVADGITSSDLNILASHINSGKHALLRLNAGQYSKGADATKTDPEGVMAGGNHWVVLSGKMTLNDKNETVTFSAYDIHGGMQTKTMNTAVFKDMINHVLMVQKKPEQDDKN